MPGIQVRGRVRIAPVVIGDGHEVLVEGLLHELECEDDFLGSIDEDQDVAKSGRLLQSLEAAIESRYAGPQRAIGLSDPPPPPIGDPPVPL